MACVAILLWPALLNGYPLVFADTGTYLSQAIRHYVGWDRPAVYSVFLLLTHWELSTWSSVLVQSLLVLYVLDLVRRGFIADLSRLSLLPVVMALGVMTPLPWYASQLMPDLFTALLPLVFALLLLRPAAIGRIESWLLMFAAAGMIGVHLSHLWIALGLLLLLLPVRGLLGARTTLGWRGAGLALAPPLLAVLALSSINLIAFHRFTVSPFGNVFLLARLVYDGPAEATLETECAARQWRICGYVRSLPPHQSQFPTSDYFLWQSDGPLARLGGAKRISDEAGQIILTTIRNHPAAVVATGIDNFSRQLVRFRSGDGLNAWSQQVEPVIGRSFPAAELHAFQTSRQSRGLLAVPRWLGALHRAAFWIGLAATILCLIGAVQHRHPVALLCAAVLLCLLGNAAVTGILSGPHDRYQNRVIWLALLVPLLTARGFYFALREVTPADAGLSDPALPVSGSLGLHTAGTVANSSA